MIMNRTAMAAVAMAVAFAAGPLFGQSAADAFDIALPAGFSEFSAQTQKSESPEGTVETTNWVSRAQTGEAVVVTVSRMPGHILDPDKLMASTRDSLLKSLSARLEQEKKIEGGRPATLLQFRSEAANPVFLQSQLIVDDDRLYQLLYVARSAEQRSSAAVGQLFASFRVREQPQ